MGLSAHQFKQMIDSATVIGSGNDQVGPVSVTSFTNVSDTAITINWSSALNATGYKLEYSLNGSTGWTQLINNTSLTSFIHSGLAPSTTYYYRVTASNNTNSSVSAVMSRQTASAAGPAEFTGFELQSSVLIQNTSASSKDFEFSLDNSTWNTLATIAAGGSYSHTGLSMGRRYHYRAVTNPSTVKTYIPAVYHPASFSAPAPVDFDGYCTANSTMTLMWGYDGTQHGISFEIQKKLSSDSTWTTLTTLAPVSADKGNGIHSIIPSFHYQYNETTAGTWDYRIRTIKDTFASAWSSTVSVLRQGRKIYVSASGSGANTGLTTGSPFQTLTQALTLANNNAGDDIVLLSNINIGSTAILWNKQNVSLDLNGFTLTGTVTDSYDNWFKGAIMIRNNNSGALATMINQRSWFRNGTVDGSNYALIGGFTQSMVKSVMYSNLTFTRTHLYAIGTMRDNVNLVIKSCTFLDASFSQGDTSAQITTGGIGAMLVKGDTRNVEIMGCTTGGYGANSRQTRGYGIKFQCDYLKQVSGNYENDTRNVFIHSNTLRGGRLTPENFGFNSEFYLINSFNVIFANNNLQNQVSLEKKNTVTATPWSVRLIGNYHTGDYKMGVEASNDNQQYLFNKVKVVDAAKGESATSQVVSTFWGNFNFNLHTYTISGGRVIGNIFDLNGNGAVSWFSFRQDTADLIVASNTFKGGGMRRIVGLDSTETLNQAAGDYATMTGLQFVNNVIDLGGGTNINYNDGQGSSNTLAVLAVNGGGGGYYQYTQNNGRALATNCVIAGNLSSQNINAGLPTGTGHIITGNVASVVPAYDASFVPIAAGNLNNTGSVNYAKKVYNGSAPDIGAIELSS